MKSQNTGNAIIIDDREIMEPMIKRRMQTDNTIKGINEN
jgi:hypothetical protein